MSSEITNEKLIRSMRSIIWEEAKGKLHAMLQTFWGHPDDVGKYGDLNGYIEAFIDTVEEKELYT